MAGWFIAPLPGSGVDAALGKRLGHGTLQHRARRKLETACFEELQQGMIGPIDLRVERAHAAGSERLDQPLDQHLADAEIAARALDSDCVEHCSDLLAAELAAQQARERIAAQRSTAHHTDADEVTGLRLRGGETLLEKMPPAMSGVAP